MKKITKTNPKPKTMDEILKNVIRKYGYHSALVISDEALIVAGAENQKLDPEQKNMVAMCLMEMIKYITEIELGKEKFTDLILGTPQTIQVITRLFPTESGKMMLTFIASHNASYRRALTTTVRELQNRLTF